MLFSQIIASPFEGGGTHLSIAFDEHELKTEGPGINMKSGTYVTAGFPAGEWTQKEVAEQLRKLADLVEKS